MHHPSPRRLIRLAQGVLWFAACFLLGLGFTVPPHPLLSLVPVAVLLVTASVTLATDTKKEEENDDAEPPANNL